ncbi:C3 and PZP-like alpha-2-macroglobulin domain-containing protein 8 [Orchesella cincta]|uniref:C3 and PZP-like alpha-2-macroglobulin domain-containing protein 8 n=1 Tax=Orchesella cincta TaxID=48709 RepID=A0A1D2NJZ5_ORCCI|nr:C3 and PZP-like alpha-2-macroglobulin domain-containing protein 8 [Orchesella cincta]
MDGASEPFLYWKNEEPFPINQLGVRTAWGSTGTWNIGGKEVNTEDSKEYTFLPVFEGSLNFEVKAKHNAHLALTGSEADAPPLYEIFLGGWENSKCAIRLNKEKPDKALVETEGCLAGGEYRKFWLKWNYGTIQVGREGEADAFMEVANPDPITVRYFGIRTGYGTDGYWHIG